MHTKTKHIPLQPLQSWQACFLCEQDSDYFWDSVTLSPYNDNFNDVTCIILDFAQRITYAMYVYCTKKASEQKIPNSNKKPVAQEYLEFSTVE